MPNRKKLASDRRYGSTRALDVRKYMHRIIVTWLVLGTVSGLAAGCGGGSSASGHGGALSASSPITKSQATVYAHAINLRAADVPEMKIISPGGAAPAPKRAAFEFARCYGGVSPARRILEIHSPEFSVGRAAYSQLEESEVEVWPTSGLNADNNKAVNRGSHERACFVRSQEADNKKINKRRAGQLLFGPLTVSPLPDPLPGVDGRFGRRITQSLLRDGRVRLLIYKDVFGFIAGPAEITLRATGFSRPVPSATEKRLLSLLYSRAEAHTLPG